MLLFYFGKNIEGIIFFVQENALSGQIMIKTYQNCQETNEHMHTQLLLYIITHLSWWKAVTNGRYTVIFNNLGNFRQVTYWDFYQFPTENTANVFN